MTEYQKSILLESYHVFGGDGMRLATVAIEREDGDAIDILDSLLQANFIRSMESGFLDDVPYNEGVIGDKVNTLKNWSTSKIDTTTDNLVTANKKLSRQGARYALAAKYASKQSRDGSTMGDRYKYFKKAVNNIETAIIGGEVAAIGFALPKPLDIVMQAKLIKGSNNKNIEAIQNKVKTLTSKIKRREIDDRAAISQARVLTRQIATIGTKLESDDR